MGDVNDNEWWSVCFILGEQEKSDAWAGCNTIDYEGKGVSVPFNSWHTMRIEIDPETALMSFFVDGQQIDQYVHSDPEAFKRSEFGIFIGVWSLGGGLVTGYYDNVRIGQ